MKNKLFFYLVITLPLLMLIWPLATGHKALFAVGLLAYALLYRPVTDGSRLLSIGKIERGDRWKLFIPFWSIKWFKSLYF
jgi:hypothetical protein